MLYYPAYGGAYIAPFGYGIVPGYGYPWYGPGWHGHGWHGRHHRRRHHW